MNRTDVEFNAEGTILRGWLYRPDGDGVVPGVVMAHGYSAVKEMYLDAFAEVFAEAGLAALADRQARARFLEHRTAALEADVDRGLVEIERLSAEVERLIAAQEERIVGLTGVRRRPEEDSDGR